MVDRDSFQERGRALEEEYFRKKDRELIEKMQRAAHEDQVRKDLGARTGLQDPEMLKELQALGFTPETISLLPLVPVVQVAWAEGGVTDGERKALIKLARARGIEEGSAADRQLDAWMTHRPDQKVFGSAGRLIAAMLAGPGADLQNLSADDLVKYCETIASASGGMLGINRVSSEERALLESIASELKGRK